ncbi:MAG: hypothetical protein NTW28_06580, partial [Candidatus Solibacter sp.]|nr:hypothetical protein [Candidatus Solibacter sp.]
YLVGKLRDKLLHGVPFFSGACLDNTTSYEDSERLFNLVAALPRYVSAVKSPSRLVPAAPG